MTSKAHWSGMFVVAVCLLFVGCLGGRPHVGGKRKGEVRKGRVSGRVPTRGATRPDGRLIVVSEWQWRRLGGFGWFPQYRYVVPGQVLEVGERRWPVPVETLGEGGDRIRDDWFRLYVGGKLVGWDLGLNRDLPSGGWGKSATLIWRWSGGPRGEVVRKMGGQGRPVYLVMECADLEARDYERLGRALRNLKGIEFRCPWVTKRGYSGLGTLKSLEYVGVEQGGAAEGLRRELMGLGRLRSLHGLGEVLEEVGRLPGGLVDVRVDGGRDLKRILLEVERKGVRVFRAGHSPVQFSDFLRLVRTGVEVVEVESVQDVPEDKDWHRILRSWSPICHRMRALVVSSNSMSDEQIQFLSECVRISSRLVLVHLGGWDHDLSGATSDHLVSFAVGMDTSRGVSADTGLVWKMLRRGGRRLLELGEARLGGKPTVKESEARALGDWLSRLKIGSLGFAELPSQGGQLLAAGGWCTPRSVSLGVKHVWCWYPWRPIEPPTGAEEVWVERANDVKLSMCGRQKYQMKIFGVMGWWSPRHRLPILSVSLGKLARCAPDLEEVRGEMRVRVGKIDTVDRTKLRRVERLLCRNGQELVEVMKRSPGLRILEAELKDLSFEVVEGVRKWGKGLEVLRLLLRMQPRAKELEALASLGVPVLDVRWLGERRRIKQYRFWFSERTRWVAIRGGVEGDLGGYDEFDVEVEDWGGVEFAKFGAGKVRWEGEPKALKYAMFRGESFQGKNCGRKVVSVDHVYPGWKKAERECRSRWMHLRGRQYGSTERLIHHPLWEDAFGMTRAWLMSQ